MACDRTKYLYFKTLICSKTTYLPNNKRYAVKIEEIMSRWCRTCCRTLLLLLLLLLSWWAWCCRFRRRWRFSSHLYKKKSVIRFSPNIFGFWVYFLCSINLKWHPLNYEINNSTRISKAKKRSKNNYIYHSSRNNCRK